MTLSVLASFDDLRRCMQVLTEGTAEEGESKQKQFKLYLNQVLLSVYRVFAFLTFIRALPREMQWVCVTECATANGIGQIAGQNGRSGG